MKCVFRSAISSKQNSISHKVYTDAVVLNIYNYFIIGPERLKIITSNLQRHFVMRESISIRSV